MAAQASTTLETAFAAPADTTPPVSAFRQAESSPGPSSDGPSEGLVRSSLSRRSRKDENLGDYFGLPAEEVSTLYIMFSTCTLVQLRLASACYQLQLRALSCRCVSSFIHEPQSEQHREHLWSWFLHHGSLAARIGLRQQFQLRTQTAHTATRNVIHFPSPPVLWLQHLWIYKEAYHAFQGKLYYLRMELSGL